MKKWLACALVATILMVLLMPIVALADDGTADLPFDFWAYITQESLVVIPVLYIIGTLLKKIPGIPDWLIPFGLLIIGIPVAMALSGWTVQGAIQGVLVTGVTVFANQLYKQGTKRF